MWATTSRVLDLDVARLDGELVARLLGDVLPHRAAAEAGHILGRLVDQAQARADDVRGVVHRDHLLPIVGPAVHVLRVRGGQVLNLAELALLVHLLDEQELAAIDDRLGHHVVQAGVVDELADLVAFLDRRGHRHGTHHVLAGLEGLDRHPGVIGNRRVDVDEIDLRVGQHVVVFGVPRARCRTSSPTLFSLASFRWQMAYMLALGWAW